MKKLFSMTVAAGAVLSAALGISLLREAPLSASAQEQGEMVTVTLTGLEDKKYELDVYRDETGTYYLADYLRNIVVCDGTSIKDWSQFDGYLRVYTSRTGDFPDKTAVTLFYNCVQVYDAYASGEVGVKLNGINDKTDNVLNNAEANGEVTVYAIAHLNDSTYRYNAAFSPQWNTNHTEITHGFMLVGDGNPEGVDPEGNAYYHFYQQARAIDTIGHEYQHGITRYVWKFSGKPLGDFGAINEAASDIFGMLIENVEENKNASSPVPLRDESWDSGTKATYDGKALYSMRNQTGSYRFSLDERTICTHAGEHDTFCDNGYVHYNSTILSSAQYEAWKKMPEAFTRQKIGALWYETIHHITESSTLEDFGREMMRAAETIGLEEAARETLRSVLNEKGFGIYRVTFRDAEGTVYGSGYAQKGGSVPLPSAVPTRESTAQFDYTFKSWNGSAENITGDVTVYAEFEETLRKYPVGFYVDGALWRTEQLEYGSTALPDPPDGYEGWYLDEETTSSADGVPVTGETKLFAKEKSDWGLIVGLSVGGAAVLAVGAVIIVIVLKKRRA